MKQRVLALLFAYLFAYLLSCGVFSAVVFGPLGLLPESLYENPWFEGALGCLGGAVQYAIVAFLFTLWTSLLPWKPAGLWAWAGTTVLNAAVAGRFLFEQGWALAPELAAAAAASWAVCWYVDQEADRPWVETAREFSSAFIPR